MIDNFCNPPQYILQGQTNMADVLWDSQRESALAILTLFSIAAIDPSRDSNPIGAYITQAFWCCIVEIAVWCPAEIIMFFMHSKRLIPPRILQKLDPIISFFWCEMTAHIVAQTVQPFIVHASLSPSLAGAATTRNATWGTLARCVQLFCVLQIIRSVSLFVRCLQGAFKDLPVLSFLHGYLGRSYNTAASYLERIIVGMLVTSLTVAYKRLDGPEFWAFNAAARALLLGAGVRALLKVLEWDAEGDEMPRDDQEDAGGGSGPRPRR